MAKPELVSVSEFARRVGVSPQAIRKGIRNGRVRVAEPGKIDAATQIERWHRTRDPSKITTGIGGRPTALTPEAGDAAESFGRLRAANLAIDLRIKQEEYRKMAADLVEREAVELALATYNRLLRDKLTNFGSRYGADIAAEIGADPKIVIAALDEFMRLQLEEIANTRFQGGAIDGEG